MKANQIVKGGHYSARISGNFTTVVVNEILERNGRTVYDVTNLTTGRRVTFRSAQRFRGNAIKPNRKPMEDEKRPDPTTSLTEVTEAVPSMTGSSQTTMSGPAICTEPEHTHKAHWLDNVTMMRHPTYYVPGCGWWSEDGSYWTNNIDRSVTSAEFDRAKILLVGGPKDGQVIHC